MSNKLPNEKDDLLELMKKLWLPIAGFIGAVTLVYNFYKLWLGDQTTITYIICGAGMIILVITMGWIGFSKKKITIDTGKPFSPKKTVAIPRYPQANRWIARGLLGVILIGATIGTRALLNVRIEQESKVIVLIAKFDGPEEKYHLHDEILRQLKASTKELQNIKILSLQEVITEAQGSDYARKIGGAKRADIVIWGWYTGTENSNLNVYIENLSPNSFRILKESEAYHPEASLSDLESLKIQQQIGAETTALVTLLDGVVQFQIQDYATALQRFENIPVEIESLSFIEPSDLYYYIGYSYFKLGDKTNAISRLNMAIDLNPNYWLAYNLRGIVRGELGQYESAIQDFSKSVSIKPSYVDAYRNRAIAYRELQKYDLAIQDFRPYP